MLARGWVFQWIKGVFVFSVFSISIATANDSCFEDLTKLERTRVYPAVVKVMEKYRRIFADNPMDFEKFNLFYPATEEHFEKWWKSARSRIRPRKISVAPHREMLGFKFLPDSVQKVWVDGRPSIFRPFPAPEDLDDLAGPKAEGVRKSWNAHRIFQKYFPFRKHLAEFEWVEIEGQWGLLSTFYEGDLEEKIDFTKVKSDDLDFAKAFQFWIGNSDLDKKKNLLLTKNGVLINFDLDLCFNIRVEEIVGGLPRLGAILPNRYPADFLVGIRSFLHEMEREFGHDLNPSEKYYLKFRAEVIAADMENRKLGHFIF